MVFSVTYYIKKIKCYFEKLGTFSQEATKSCRSAPAIHAEYEKKQNSAPISGNHNRKTDISGNPYRAFACNVGNAPERSGPQSRLLQVQRRKTPPCRNRNSDTRKA
jgi:hypothetical protein